VPTPGLADRPFLSRQERPPPKRPPTCWCPLEARASPAPPVRPNQGPDRGEPVCEITPLSCSHWARDTLHPTPFLCSPPLPTPPLPHPASILHPMSMAPFWRKRKREKERDREKQGNNCTMGVFYCVWGYSQNSSYSRPQVTAEAKVEIPVRFSALLSSFIVWRKKRSRESI